MALDLGKVFGFALRYPLRKDVFFVLFAVTLIFSLLSWFLTGYLIGDVSALGGAGLAEIIGGVVSSAIYLGPVIIAGWLVGIFLTAAYFDNSAKFFKGKRKPILGSFEIAKERFLPLLVTLIILGLVLLACFGGFLFILIPTLIAPQTGLIFLVAGVIWILAGLVIGAVVAFMTFLSPVFCVLDKTGPVDSIKKSWNLIGKNKLNTFLFFIIFFVIFIAVSLAGSIPEIVFAFFAGEIPLLSIESFSFLVFRMIFTVYLNMFAYSSYVNYYLSTR
ncbi:MAG: hypothetical protein JSV39_03650 [Candidatus Aenigmatarchaeota archaeon]|nr:MAG: hypothetical protein JSV39_03650 [Candidatus Aenigmarchaeota archaeon]